MDLAKFDGKHVRVTDKWGETLGNCVSRVRANQTVKEKSVLSGRKSAG